MSVAWKSFWPIQERLEAEVCELSFALAYSDDHLRVYSSRLADLLLRACAECENVGKALCLDKGLVASGTTVERFNFPTVGNAICSRIAIQTKVVSITWPYQSFTATDIVPFNTWRPAESTNPTWFDAYNGVKHDRIGNAKSASVENVIHALAGLFVLNLWLRESEITGISEHIDLARRRIVSYSQFFSAAQFLTLESRDGMSGPMSGGNLRSLVFHWA